MTPPSQAPPRDEMRAAVAGIAGWIITFVVLVVCFRHDLARHHATWWLWSCGLGVVLGLYGLRAAHRRSSG